MADITATAMALAALGDIHTEKIHQLHGTKTLGTILSTLKNLVNRIRKPEELPVCISPGCSKLKENGKPSYCFKCRKEIAELKKANEALESGDHDKNEHSIGPSKKNDKRQRITVALVPESRFSENDLGVLKSDADLAHQIDKLTISSHAEARDDGGPSQKESPPPYDGSKPQCGYKNKAKRLCKRPVKVAGMLCTAHSDLCGFVLDDKTRCENYRPKCQYHA